MSTMKQTAGISRASGVDRIRTPHKAYMKLSSLELEKARLLQEHATLAARIRTLEERVRAIETEQRTLHGILPAHGTTGPRSGGPGLSAQKTEAQPGLQTDPVRPAGMASMADDKDRLRFRY